MTKPKPKPASAARAVEEALARLRAKRPHDLKPIELVKAVICSYQAFTHGPLSETTSTASIESPDRKGLRRGTQAAVDRLLFNANYWLAAYEDRIVDACRGADETEELLGAVTVWGTHTLKLNTLGADETLATFERFCPPFAENRRRGTGKGPVAQFEEAARALSAKRPECAPALSQIIAEMHAEADAYARLDTATALDALFAILPAWCLQERIDFVNGGWWDDADVMGTLADALQARFLAMGFGEVPCHYFRDSIDEALDSYQRDISSTASSFASMPIPRLIDLVHNAREAHPTFETDGYGDALPAWLAAKEQLIWNTVVCALFGPATARPLLARAAGSLVVPSGGGNRDVITDLARRSFERYATDRTRSGKAREYDSFFDQPADLKNSGIEHIKSIPGKLDVLGYEIVPDGSCYPDQRICALTPSEVECLAILEHRRWIAERTEAGWQHGAKRDVAAKTSPYLVPWEDLPDRAREWNRSAIRNIPALLAGESLAIARK